MIKFVRISLITFYVMLPQSTYPLILNGGFNYSPLVLDAKLLEPVVFRPVSFSYHPWTFIFNPAFKNYKLYRKGNAKTNDSVEISGRSRLRIKGTARKPGNDFFESAIENEPSSLNSLLDLWPLAAGAAVGLAGISIPTIAFGTKTIVQMSNEVGRSCTGLNGQLGFCATIFTCRLKNGMASGFCPSGGKCCINTVNKCEGTITYNNTYWQSPNFVGPDSPCSVTVTLDPTVVEQRGPICQLRIDFEKFTIAQPNSEGVCNEDIFQVGGTDRIPSICGDNEGQHMYLNVPAPESSILLSFKFGTSFAKREWKMNIAMLACVDSFLLAPFGCLQYFTSQVGTIKSFNWADTKETATRQLVNQEYQICFRKELIDKSVSTTLCFAASVTKEAKPFSLSGSEATAGNAGKPDLSQASLGDCNNDYLIIISGYNPLLPSGPSNLGDRYCGERLNPLSKQGTSVTVCTQSKPFRITYHTNADETLTDSRDAAGLGFLGFFLRYEHRLA